MSPADAPGPFIFIIAGEPSGDALGAALIRGLRANTPGLRLAGIGGEQMAAEGLHSLVPLSDLAVAGLIEVLPRAPLILRRIREATAAVRTMRPDIVVTIDSSSFTWRVAARLRRQGESLPLVHYVAPMVWAWRSGRARHMARWYDHLLTLLPFEPPYFDKVGLAASFVGHPVVESGADCGDAARFRAEHAIAPDELVLSVLPGSRSGEVRRLMPVFGAALQQLEAKIGRFRVAVPTVATVADTVAAGVSQWPGRPILLRGNAAKYDAFAASRAALAASGTVALELAAGRVPMAIAYRMNRLTEMVLDRVVKVRQANLVNLLLMQPLVPEHLGPACAPEPLVASLITLIRDERVRSLHLEGYDQAIRRLRPAGNSPSHAAADHVLAILAAQRDRRHLAARSEPPMTDTGTDTALEAGGARLLHTMLRVKELDKSLHFYNDLLGMKLLRKRDYPTGKFTLAFVGYGEETDSTVIELTHNWGQEEPYALGTAFGHLAIGVPDVYQACEKLAAAGVKIARPAGPMAHGGAVIAFIEDPDGYRIELVQRS